MAVQQRGIQTVESSGEILKLICHSTKSLSLSEIAEALNLAPSSAYKYLISLQRTGLLKRNESTLAFEAGSLSLRLGLAKVNQNVLVVKSRQLLTEIAEKHQVNVFASLWSNLQGPTVVFYKEFAGFFNLGFRLGANLTLSTATGRLFAAYQSLEANCEILKPYIHEQTIFQNDEFQQSLNEIREQGYSCFIDQPTPGISSYAVPVFDHNQQLIFAMTVFSKTEDLNAEKIQHILQDLSTAAVVLRGNQHG